MKSKTTQYALNGSIIGGIFNGVIDLFTQMAELDLEQDQKFDWNRFILSTSKGALIGGLGGALLGSLLDYENEQIKVLNTDDYLLNLLPQIALNKEDKTFVLFDQKAVFITNWLKMKLQNKLFSEPIRLGSTEKDLALKNKFDIDVCFPFKPYSFANTKLMYDHVYNELFSLIGLNGVTAIREQRKSIGVIVEIMGQEYKIDIVPYKITSKDVNSTAGYLHVNNLFGSSYTKTDVHALKKNKLSKTQKEIFLLLKYWKSNHDFSISSHLLEYLVIDAFKRNKMPRSKTQKLLTVLQHIRDNFGSMVIRSVENSNNVLTNISEEKKWVFISACKEILSDYDYQPNSILTHFGVYNEALSCKAI